MTDSNGLTDLHLEQAERLGRRAAESLDTLLTAPVRNVTTDFSTDRAIALEAMIELATSYPGWIAKSVRERLATEHLLFVRKVNASKVDRRHPRVEGDYAPELLRRSVLIGAMSAVLGWSPRERDLSDDGRRARDKLEKKIAPRLFFEADELASAVSPALAEGHAGAEIHPYICWRVMRSLDQLDTELAFNSDQDATHANERAERREAATSELWSALRKQLDTLLARHQLGLINRAETVALAFGAAAAGLRSDGRRHVEAAMHACLEAPGAATVWSEGRVIVREERDDFARRLTVPSFEILWAAAETLLPTLGERDRPLLCADRVLKALALGVDVARDTLVEHGTHGGPPGWSVEQMLGRGGPESWPTTSVLQMAVGVRKVGDMLRRMEVLQRYDTVPTWEEDWPSWLKWDDYYTENEPDEEGMILDFIHRQVVLPRAPGPLNRRSDPVVVLLFGPPGTTKTTIARGVANGLGWPTVNLSPGDFLREGMDNIEKRATEVFRDLHRLSRAVVILDESDELFRERRPVPESEAIRGVAAFMTASMLPRLQDLHDRGRVVLFVCTNFLSSIDPAMRRLGRVDHIIAVPPPDERQRLSIINRELKAQKAEGRAHMAEGAARLAEQTERFIRGEIVAAARELASRAPKRGFQSVDAAGRRAREIADNRRPTIAIKTDDPAKPAVWEPFLEDLRALSEPHRQRRRSSWVPPW
jgi:hypothetical protein